MISNVKFFCSNKFVLAEFIVGIKNWVEDNSNQFFLYFVYLSYRSMKDDSNNIYTLVKNQEWGKVKTEINKNPNFDINTQDNAGNYLITYAVMYNNIDFLEFLLSKNCRIDIIDNDGHLVIYNPIRFNYTEIIDKILEYDNNTIGISINEIFDRYNHTVIHYCIQFNNLKTAEKIISNINTKRILDKDGNTILNYAIKYNKTNFIKLFMKNISNINHQNKSGETALHIAVHFENFETIQQLIKNGADVNIFDYENNVTPLFYAIVLNNVKISKYLLNVPNIDINYQDIGGDSALFHAVKEKSVKIINSILEKDINYNLTDINGDTVLHLLLSYEYIDIIDNVNFIKILKNTNLNIQNNKKISALHKLAYNNILFDYEEIIKNKRINIYNKDNEKKTVIDLVKDKERLYKLTAHSYLNTLKRINESWAYNWENECSKNSNVTSEKLLKLGIDKTLLNDLVDKKNICYSVIYNFIKKNNLSLPLKKKSYCINLDFNRTNNFTTYSGTNIDIMFGLINIMNKNDNVLTTLNQNFENNTNLQNYYSKNGIRKISVTDYDNYEIIWYQQRLFFPTDLHNQLTILKKYAKKHNKRFFLIPLGITLEIGSHANILIYDLETNEIERFEPYGYRYPFNFNYYPDLLDSELQEYFENKMDGIIKYIKPSEYIPRVAFQTIESIEQNKNIGDPGGFCSAWCLWYANKRIQYPNVGRKKLIQKLLRLIKSSEFTFKELIREYTIKITLLRDKELQKAGIDINNWLNENMTEEQLNKVNNNLVNIIKKIQIPLVPLGRQKQK